MVRGVTQALRRHLVRFVLGVALVLVMVGHVVDIWSLPFVAALDAYLYDVRVRLTMPDTLDDRVVIVDLDERSLEEVGRWPWSRNQVGELVQRLTDEYQAAVVGFDVVFAEPDKSSGLSVLEKMAEGPLRHDRGYQTTLAGMRAGLDYDQRFADILKGRPVVMGYYFSGQENAHKAGALPPPVFPPGFFGQRAIVPVVWKGYGGNLADFQAAARTAGHFNPLVDGDGVSRRVPLVVQYDHAYYESLSLAMVRVLLGGAGLRPGYPDAVSGPEWFEISSPFGSLGVPVDENMAALIPYRGHERSFPYISAADVLKGRANPEIFRGRAVLIGTTAPGLLDLRSTPVGATYPGVEIHANMIAGMLDGSIRQKPAFALGMEVLQMLIFGGMLAILLPLLSPLRATLLTLGVVVLLLGVDIWLWQSALMLLPIASSLVLLGLLYAVNMSWGYFIESRSKRQFTELFGQYVPPELVDEMARNPESYSMEGRNQELTVLFSDVRSFTTISEGLDPKELSQLMNEYLGCMTQLIRANRGTLDKYIGDAIMAFWGAPVDNPQHPRAAVLTALEMQRALRTLDEPFKARGWPQLHIGVGVNTGVMTVGDMGSPVRKAYTVMGDAVNLGSRLEGITKQYGVGVIVGEQTWQHLKDDMAFRELDRVRVKGKEEPIAIYEPWGETAALSAGQTAELLAWHAALADYRLQHWDQAELALKTLLKDHPCYLYELYIKRIAHYRQHPPGEAWDGVTTFETK